MPMSTIDTQLITQFTDRLHVVAQQKVSRLQKAAMVLPIKGDRFAYDGLGTGEARELTGRFNKTEVDDIEFFRRKIARRRFVRTFFVDKYDVESMLTDPTSPLVMECHRSMERVKDRLIIEAATADVYTGRDFENTVTAASDGVLTVDATAGLTLAKLLTIQQNWLDNEVGNDEDIAKYFAISGDEHNTMLQITQLTSGDYSRQFGLEGGSIQKAVGLNLVKFGASAKKPVLGVSGGVRTNIAMTQDAIALGIARAPQVTVKDRPDYVDTKQIQITAVFGAVRTEGKLVQKVTTTD